MIGRIVAAVVLLAAVGLFVWSYGPDQGRTVQQTLVALGLSESHSQTTAVFRDPGYESRVERAPAAQ